MVRTHQAAAMFSGPVTLAQNKRNPAQLRNQETSATLASSSGLVAATSASDIALAFVVAGIKCNAAAVVFRTTTTRPSETKIEDVCLEHEHLPDVAAFTIAVHGVKAGLARSRIHVIDQAGL